VTTNPYVLAALAPGEPTGNATYQLRVSEPTAAMVWITSMDQRFQSQLLMLYIVSLFFVLILTV